MAENMLDCWVRLIKAISPANALIHSRFSNNDYLIQINWKLQNDSESPTKHSKSDIIIKELIIEDYLDKNKKDRETSDIMMKGFICERYNHFIPDNDFHTNQQASTRVVNL